MDRYLSAVSWEICFEFPRSWRWKVDSAVAGIGSTLADVDVDVVVVVGEGEVIVDAVVAVGLEVDVDVVAVAGHEGYSWLRYVAAPAAADVVAVVEEPEEAASVAVFYSGVTG